MLGQRRQASRDKGLEEQQQRAHEREHQRRLGNDNKLVHQYEQMGNVVSLNVVELWFLHQNAVDSNILLLLFSSVSLLTS